MIKLEQIARDLAAVLSPEGEADWPQYLALARTVEKSLNRQLGVVFHLPPEKDSEQVFADSGARRSTHVALPGKD